VPRPGPGEVLIKVQSTGVCASDIKCYTGAALFWGDEHRVGYCQAPVTPGHEFVGEVVGLGDGAGELYGLKIGDHAISEQIVPCWNCRYCKTGAYWMCNVHDIYGFRQRTFGSWADYMLFPAGALNYKVPDSIPLHHAVFIEPLACSIHAVERGDIKFQDTVVIAGCGPLGLGMVAAAKMNGAARIIALDDDEFHAELEQRFGLHLGEIKALDRPRAFPLGYFVARSFIAERLALIGDAAHVIHPIAGQGLNMGLKDVAALAEVVVDAARLGIDLGQADVLERYQRWRRFDTMAMGVATNSLNLLFSNESTLLRTVRDIGLGLVDRTPPLKEMFIRQAAGLSGDVPRLLKGEAL